VLKLDNRTIFSLGVPRISYLAATRSPTRCSAADAGCGQLSFANDAVTISPAGSYVPITTPVVETLLSTSRNPDGMVPSANRRLPVPMMREGPQAVLVDEVVAQ
jgi:hypothetical protein